MPYGGVVHREERQRVHVEDPHGLRVGLEQQAVAPVGLLGLPIDPGVLDRERGPLAQLAGEVEVGLGEAPAVLAGGGEGDDAGEPTPGTKRNLKPGGRRQRAVDLELLRFLGPLLF
jgi:hypothetical protein